MKAGASGINAHILLGRTTLAEAMKVTRPDGEVYGFTSADEDDEVSGQVYSASQGLNLSEIVTATGTQVGTLELSTLDDGTLFYRSDIMNGLWRNSAFEIFRYNWTDPTDGIIPLLSGNFGEVTRKDGFITIELRDLRQFLQQKVGSPSTKTCRYRLGSAKCRIDLSDTSKNYTGEGVVTSLESNQIFTDNLRTEPDDWFGEGYIQWVTGNNAGSVRKVKSYSSGRFVLVQAMFAEVEAGDAYIPVVGCRHRFDEDCVTKFENGDNFGGEPHRLGLDSVTQSPD